MKTITVLLTFLLCGLMLYPQTVTQRSSKNLEINEIQNANISQSTDSLRQGSNQQKGNNSISPGQRIQTQLIPLSKGWSGISSNLNPDNPAIFQMLAAIEQQLIILKDFDGNIYQPSIENTLVNWDFRQGYFIKMASAETLEIIGLEPLSKQIDLQTGWNLIPVLSEVGVNIEDYFFDNISKIEIVTEVAGVNVFWPDKEIVTLTQLIPGKAYLVKVIAPFSLFRLPTIATATVSDITMNTAVSGGNVSEIGSSPVTSRGIVWNTDGNPTVDFNQGITLDGQGVGEYVSTLTGLTPATFYYVRAYATNHVGTAYGEELVFVTLLDLFTCGEAFTDSRDGQQYPTVHIGNQCWMAANLNIGEMVSGNVDQLDNGIIEKHCYNNSIDKCSEYGGLYQWDEVMKYTTVEGVQGICPEGWYFPADEQWTILENYLGGYLVAGGKLKEAGTAHWLSPNVGATNSSGFTALGGGFLSYDRIFFNLKSTGVFWTSTAPPNEYPWPRILNHNLEVVYRFNYYPTTTSFSVRCFKDAPAQVNIPTVITTPVTAITSSSAASGGTITEDGGAWVTSRGIVWSMQQTPTVEVFEGITYDGNGAGEFSSVMTNLIPETTYFIRAYATNSKGTAYGDELSFTTQSLSFVCGNTFTDSRDGNQYNTVQIGSQCWFAENLAYLPVVSPPSEGSYVDPLYYVYGYFGYSPDEAKTFQNYQAYGALYNRAAAATACPQGWHLPSDNEWKILEGNADGQYGVGNPVWDIADWRGSDVGKNLKTTDGWYINTGTDLIGFSAMPAGYRYITGDFIGLTQSGGWWTSSDNHPNTAWYRYLNSSYNQAYRYWDDKSFGLSVRCLMNESQANLPTVITSDIVNYTVNTASALCGGTVTDEGGSAVTSRGVVWNTSENPTIENNVGITFDGSGAGEYLSYLVNLNMGTQYFVRAYATNEAGTAYGVQKDFNTEPVNVNLCIALDNCDLNFITYGYAQWFLQYEVTYDGEDAAQSGPMPDDQEVWMETTIEGPGLLSFWWKVSSEQGYDILKFFIDDLQNDGIDGEVDWQYKEYMIPAGYHTLKWSYSKDGSASAGFDCGWVDQVQLSPLASLCEALDNCTLNFSTGGTTSWFLQTVTTFDGSDAAQSGAIPDEGFSWLETIVEGPGTLTFYWKVSSEENFDFLSFYIDGVPVDLIWGEIDWHYKEFAIPAGYKALTWWYVKDGSVSSGQDAGWVDQVQFSPSSK